MDRSKAALRETVELGGCFAGAAAGAAKGGAAGLALGSPSGPGAFITAGGGAVVGGLIGCIGGAFIAGTISDVGYELIVPRDATGQELTDQHVKAIYDHIPSETSPNMPPELESLVGMKQRISKLEVGTDAHEAAMQELKDFLKTDIKPDTTQQIISYMEFSKNKPDTVPAQNIDRTIENTASVDSPSYNDISPAS